MIYLSFGLLVFYSVRIYRNHRDLSDPRLLLDVGCWGANALAFSYLTGWF